MRTMIDKVYCMSSYLALRYIEDDDRDFCAGLRHTIVDLPSDEDRIAVRSADEIDQAIADQLERFSNHRKGILLSGGMDSAILASYLSGADAYTFRFLNGNFQKEELERAKYFASYYGLRLHYVDIDFEIVEGCVDAVMATKAAPVHSIEPQIYRAAVQAKEDGVEVMIIGDGSDYVFGGMDKLLSRDWSFDAFMERYIYLNPADVLKEHCSMEYLFDRYRTKDGIDFQRFMDVVATEESYDSYNNAFRAARMKYYDPYARLVMAEPLDLARVRSGESKYLVRELMKKKYPGIPVPEKNPMPRPVDQYFDEWKGPVRREFLENLDMTKFTGNQKWLLWCLERFLNTYDKQPNAGL